MPSSKGKPTDPKLREEVKEDVQQVSVKREAQGCCEAELTFSRKQIKTVEVKGNGLHGRWVCQ
jgi:hypothetical protein